MHSVKHSVKEAIVTSEQILFSLERPSTTGTSPVLHLVGRRGHLDIS